MSADSSTGVRMHLVSAAAPTGTARVALFMLGALCVIATTTNCRACAVPASTSTSAAVDTARGVVSLVGSEPMSTLLLRLADAIAEPFALGGAGATLLRQVVGLEVMIRGRRTGRRDVGATPRGAPVLEVERFVVRAADGVAATDGVVVSRNGEFALRLADGTESAAPMLPASLRRLIGARVWVAGRLDASPQSYGVIAQAR